MANWKNSDGLYIKFGTSQATTNTAGEYKTYGELREVEVTLTLTDVTSSAAIISDALKFPTGVRIQEVDVVTHTAGTGTGAVLNIGLIGEDRSTEIDYDGFVAAIPLTSLDAAGETTTLRVGSTYAGALLGTATSSVGYLTADYDTAAFTAGVVRIRIKYYGYGTISQ